MTTSISERMLDLGDVQVGLLECGPPDGPLVLCLHGFPDTAYTYRHLLGELAAAGYHGVAANLRGYAPTSLAPDGRYPLARLVDDAVRCYDALGGDERGAVVGHDWGSAVAHAAAALRPRSVGRVVMLAVPPPAVFAASLLDFDQLQRSFYMFFFQTPLAEGVVSANGYEFLARLWRKWSPGYDPSADLARVTAALGRPENLSAALGYYRAMFDFSVPEGLEDAAAAAMSPAARPTLYLHGRSDGCLGVEVLERPENATALQSVLGQHSAVEYLDGLGHFLHLEAPRIVNQRILAWLDGS